jgi:hypothetical protein
MAPSPSPRPLRKGARQRAAISLQHAAFGDQSAHQRGHVEGVIGEHLQRLPAPSRSARPPCGLMVATSSAPRCRLEAKTRSSWISPSSMTRAFLIHI